MAEPIYGLTSADVAKLRRLIEFAEKQGFNFGRATRPEDDPTAPETYVALVPTDGIPGRDGLTPGSAECQLFVVRNRTAEPQLGQIGKIVTVFNVSTEAIEAEGTADLYIPVTRDKFGTWLATSKDAPTPPSGQSIMRVCHPTDPLTITVVNDDGTSECVIIDPCPGTGTDDCGTLYYCDTELGIVAVAVGDPPPANWDGNLPYNTEAEAEEVCGMRWWCVTGETGPQPAPMGNTPTGATSGPYDTAAEAAAACPILISGCATPYPSTITLTFSGFTGGCAGLNGSVDLDWDGSTWTGTYAAPAGDIIPVVTPSAGGGGTVSFNVSYTSTAYTVSGSGGIGACGAYPVGGIVTVSGGCTGSGTGTLSA